MAHKVFPILFSALSVLCTVPQNPGTVHHNKALYYTKDHFGNFVEFDEKDVVVIDNNGMSLVVKFDQNFRVTFIPIWTRSLDNVQ
jgi:hypothetical protein